MSKRFAIILSVFALMVGLVGLTQTTQVSAAHDEVTICHRTNSASNPYVQITVDDDAVDGFGNSDHYGRHKGPVFNPNTMTNGDDWGDIIPPVLPFHLGLNWNAAGRAIYNNGCNIPGPDGTSVFETECESLELIKPEDVEPISATYQYYLDGQAVALGTHQVQAGAHTLVLKVNGVTVDTDNITINACPAGNSNYRLACESLTLLAPTGVAPQGASYQYYLDGQAISLGAHQVAAGQHALTLRVNGTLVDTDNLSVDACPAGTSRYELACESLTLLAPTGVVPQGASYQYYLDGQEIAEGTHEVTAGQHTLTLKVNGTLVDTDNLSVEECPTTGTSSYRVACESLTLLEPTGIAPQDADYQYYLDGEAIALGTHELEAGEYTLVLKVNGVTVDTDELSIEECGGGQGSPNVSATLVCNADTKTFTMTLTNSGDAVSKIVLNGEAFDLEAGSSVNKDIVDNGEGVLITLTVDGQVYGEGDNAFDGTRPFFCKQGNGGGETPTNPTTPTVPTAPVKEVTSLPRTGGVAPLVSLIVIISTAMATVAGYLWQNRAGSQL